MPSIKPHYLFPLAVTALLAPPAWSQSFRHAPPTPARATSLLPIIQPRQTTPPSRTTTEPAVPARAELSPPTPPTPPAAPQPSESERARQRAAAAVNRGDLVSAEQILVEATERLPFDARLVAALGRTRELRGNHSAALAAYDTLVQLEPSMARWRRRRAECLYQLERYSEAVADYKTAADTERLSFDEYAHFGDAAMRVEDFDAAEAAFDALAKLHQEPMPQIELLRGLTALKQGKADVARTILLRASGRWPRDAAITDALRLASAAYYGDAPSVQTAVVTPAAPLRSAPSDGSAAKESLLLTSASMRHANAAQPPSDIPLHAASPAEVLRPRHIEPTAALTPTVTPGGANSATNDRLPTIGRWRQTRPRPQGEPHAEPRRLVEVTAFALEGLAAEGNGSSPGWRPTRTPRDGEPALLP